MLLLFIQVLVTIYILLFLRRVTNLLLCRQIQCPKNFTSLLLIVFMFMIFLQKKILPLAKTLDQGPEVVGWKADGKEVIVFEFFKSMFRLYGVPTDGGIPHLLSSINDTTLYPVLYEGSIVYFISHNFDRPDEAFSLDLRTKTTKRLTFIQPTNHLPEIEVQALSWPSTDGLTIEGTLILPSKKNKKPLPLVVLAHGGQGIIAIMLLQVFPINFLFLLCPTYQDMAVLWVYFRGSDGYGLDFRWANYRNFWEGTL